MQTMKPGSWHAQLPGKKTTVAWLVTLARAGYGVALIGAPGATPPPLSPTGRVRVPPRRTCARRGGESRVLAFGMKKPEGLVRHPGSSG